MKIRKTYRRYSKKELTAWLLAWKQKHGEAPSRRQLDEDVNSPSSYTYRLRFGSWGNALKEIGAEVRKPTISPQCREATIKAHKGKRSCAWKGGRIKDKFGYFQIWKPEHPNAKMGRGKSYVHEHRLVMSNHLGRPLTSKEFVHHKNGVKDDNRLENLELMTKQVHRGKVECPYCQKEFTIR